MMKKTVALLAVAGLAAATSDFQDDYLALRLTNATRHANSTRVNTTTPIKPIKPIRPHPVRPGMIPKDRLTISTKNLTKEEREILNKLYKRQSEKTQQQQIRRPVPSVRPKPHTNATNSTKPVHPKKVLAQRLDDDEFYAEDDEFFAEDDEFYAEDDEFFAEDDEFYAEDDFFYAEDDEYFTAKNVTIKPHVKPSPIKANHTMIPRPRPGMIPRPKVNNTMIPRPRPGLIPRPKVNSTAIPKPRGLMYRPKVNSTAIPRPRVNATKPAQNKPTRLPIKPERNATKVLARDDDEFFAEDDEFFADEDEFWVDIDDEFFAEDDEFYAEDDEFYAEDDEFYAEDDEFYAEDDEYFVDADDDFFAARLHNRTQTVKPARNSTLGRLDSLLKEAKKDVIKAKDTLKNATRPAIKEIKHDFKNLTAKGKELFKNATKPAAPKKGFLSMF